jgi:hypothetical protein
MATAIECTKQRARRRTSGWLARAACWFLATCLVAAALLGGYFFCLLRGVLPLYRMPAEAPMMDIQVESPGIRTPPVRAAADAGLDDNADVIGICAGGRARAYSLGEMGTGPARHVVNDLVGGWAVTVTYCNVTGCTRAYSAGPAKEPLDLGVGGFNKEEGGLVLRDGGKEYAQTTGKCLSPGGGSELPYMAMEPVHTTWKAWREEHPDTDVYVGDLPEDQVPPPPTLSEDGP